MGETAGDELVAWRPGTTRSRAGAWRPPGPARLPLRGPHPAVRPGAEVLHHPWSLHVTVLPFGRLLFLAWSMACGDLWAAPVAAGIATFLIQTHVGFVVLVAPVLAWSLAVLVWPVFRDRVDPERGRPLLRSGLMAAGVLCVLWLPPALDHIFHSDRVAVFVDDRPLSGVE